MAEGADVTVIGAGVVGLAVAAALAARGRKVYILEKNERYGQETSSRNSQVIHAGLYYPPGCLKARTCVEGNRLLYELCARYGVPYRRLGKLVVATEAEEEPRLEALARNAAENGVTGLRLLTSRQVAELEPRVRARAGLLVPDTGIVDVHRLMELYVWLARERGAELVCRTEVVGLEYTGAGYLVWVRDREGTYPFRSRVVVNSAGLGADRVAAMAGLDVDRLGYRLHYCKGHYFSVCPAKSRLVSRLVYPVPHPQVTGLGIHVTLDLGGRMRLGPDALYVDEPEYGVDEGRRHLFWEGARRFLPDLEPEDLSPEMAGVRPKLQGPGQPQRDFVVRHEADRGLPGFVNLIGIESPGLTASPAIARLVAEMVGQ